MMNGRNERLRAMLTRAGLDAVFFTGSANQRYLEGFTGGDCFLISDGERSFMLADSRCAEQARAECRAAEIVPFRKPHPPLEQAASAVCRHEHWTRVGFEAEAIGWKLCTDLAAAMKEAGTEFVPAPDELAALRAVKDAGEAAAARRACEIADAALEETLPYIREGVSELDVVIELDYRMKRLGADDVSFDTMVLFGANAASPHATPKRASRLKRGEMILIDYGAAFEGMRSDTTRTFAMGEPSSEARRAYSAVLAAQELGVSLAAPGADTGETDRRVFESIERAGFIPYGHALGHGVGLEIHEYPSLRRGSSSRLETGMIVTIEPGIYIPGKGGIRIEDTVLITENGCEVLTRFPKGLIVL